ncbi:hypothetical protein EV421DRAFT_1741956 [Armillaria borealis]|uniref:Uncharacterized protein n=1 Tax=Armillaria borealis TaxID=47425 RepID=A0AA39IYR7_9AGAR|nr:hypothetical protein EV421DRAFT_1741956 [Armillaria borealis]
MHEWKHEETLQDLRESNLLNQEYSEIITLLQEWNQTKISDAGGLEVWQVLPAKDCAAHNLVTIALEGLKEQEKCTLTLYLWSGCCMHKDQKSFQGGNAAMMASWKELSLLGPILLANKYNAQAIHWILSSEKGSKPVDDSEIATLETSTCGGAKAAALSDAIFNNRFNKKGQPDTHVYYFIEELGQEFWCFPQTNNTCFGSYSKVAGELVTQRQKYIELEFMKDKKTTSAWTNIELNMYNALKDPTTLTELTILALYQQVITHPYMHLVRGPGAKNLNILDVGPLHVEVRDLCQKIIDNPDLVPPFKCDPESYIEAALDGKKWE